MFDRFVFHFLLKQKGFSLIELMVVLFLSVVVSGAISHYFIQTQIDHIKTMDKGDRVKNLLVFKKFIKIDMDRASYLSLGTLGVNAVSPQLPSHNFFDYYPDYPAHLLEHPERAATFRNTDAQDSRIHFLRPHSQFDKEYSINVLNINAQCYRSATTNVDTNYVTGRATTVIARDYKGDKACLAELGAGSILQPNNLIMFYTPIYLRPLVSDSIIDIKKPTQLYALLGTVTSSSSIAFNDRRLFSSGNNPSPRPPSASAISIFHEFGNPNTLESRMPLVGGNHRILKLLRVEWLTYFFKTGSEGGKLYRCIKGSASGDSVEDYCNDTTGMMLIDKVKEISFHRYVDSPTITIGITQVKI